MTPSQIKPLTSKRRVLKGFKLYYAKPSTRPESEILGRDEQGLRADWSERQQNANGWQIFSDRLYSQTQVDAIIGVCKQSCPEFIFQSEPVYQWFEGGANA